MAASRSRLPIRVTQGYWTAVRELLEKRDHLSPEASRKAVQNYQEMLKIMKVGNVVYHEPISETVKGIVNGDYVSQGNSASSAENIEPSRTALRGQS